MSTPPLSIEQLQEAVRVWSDCGQSVATAATRLGLNFNTFKYRLDKAKRMGLHLSDGARNAVLRAGLNGIEAQGGWIHDYDGEGKKLGTTRWAAQRKDAEEAVELIDQAAESALARIRETPVPAPEIARPRDPDESLMGLLPLFDAHLGLSMPGYGLQRAVDRVRNAAFEALDAMPSGGCIAVINGGDLTHQNSDDNQTPKGKHPLPIDGTYTDATDAATDLRIAITERAAEKFGKVITKDLRGNHDPSTARIVRAALVQRYREHDRISFDADGITYWAMTWGKNLLTAHHGDIKRSLKDVALGLCHKYRIERGKTVYHEHHFGHTHHIKESRMQIGGVHMCQHSALSILSNYDEDNLFTDESILQGITYRASGGRKGSVEVYMG